MGGLLKSIYMYRGFIMSSIRNEFVSRFSRSRLGGVWMVIHPLVQVAIYALILSNLLAAKLPGIDNKYAYAMYLMAGILAWTLFSEIVGRCLTVFIDNGGLIKKMRFPRITLPVIVVGSCLINYAILLVCILVVFVLMGNRPGLEIFWIFPMTVFVIALAVGIGLLLGVLNVFIRDIGQVVPIFLQVLFWFTPIVYPLNVIPESVKNLVAYNPMYKIVGGYHDILVYGKVPGIEGMLSAFLISLALMALGLFVFRRAAPEMVDAL